MRARVSDGACLALCALLVLLPGPASAQNLLHNPGFEEGTAGWLNFGPCSIAPSTTQFHGDSSSVLVSERTETWQGVYQDLRGRLPTGEPHWISGWVRPAGPEQQLANLMIKQEDDAGIHYHSIATASLSHGTWTELAGPFTLEVTGTLQQLLLYFEGPQSGSDFYADDVMVEPLLEWRVEANGAIEQHRKRDARVSVVDPRGRPLPEVSVRVRQLRHDFAFGSALASDVIDNPQYAEFFRQHFEWAVFENETKWHKNEPSQGALDYGDADAMLAFCEANDIRVHGHSVFWALEDYVQDWVKALDDEQLRAALDSRIESVVSRYAGRFAGWDVNNQMLHGDYFQQRLGPSIRPWMFQRSLELDQSVRLFVNDQSVVADDQTEAYKAQIQGLIDDGTPLDAIGAMGHFFEPVAPEALRRRLDSLAELGLPVWISEYDYAHPDDAVRADQLESTYRVAFAHPGVDGILMWGFWAGRHWRGADAALVDLDWSPNRAWQRFATLMDEWTTVTGGTTEADGKLLWRGIHGRYEIELIPATGTPATHLVSLPAGPGPADFLFTLVVPYCGDAHIDAGEECDGGGIDTPTCDTDCTLAACGDGYLNRLAGEECDDGNTAAGDGCDPSCADESCFIEELSRVEALRGVKTSAAEVLFSWEGDPEAFQYHLNSVATKQQLVDPRRPPGAGTAQCDAMGSTTTCLDSDALSSPQRLLHYQVLSACGEGGQAEGPR